MRFFGKLAGLILGGLVAGLWGALIGLWLGFLFDRARSKRFTLNGWHWRRLHSQEQELFFYTTFAVMGHIAKSSGQVSSAEIRVVSVVMDRMHLHGELRERMQEAFRDGKSASFPLVDSLQRFRASCQDNRELLHFFLELQLQAAFADGLLHPNESDILHTIAQVLGFSVSELQQLLAMNEAAYRFFHRHNQGKGEYQGYTPGSDIPPRAEELQDAYQLLGVDASDSDEEVKKGYRRQMSQHHPDKLVAKGLPKEMLEMAKEKAQEIQNAWEIIKKSRGIR